MFESNLVCACVRVCVCVCNVRDLFCFSLPSHIVVKLYSQPHTVPGKKACRKAVATTDMHKYIRKMCVTKTKRIIKKMAKGKRNGISRSRRRGIVLAKSKKKNERKKHLEESKVLHIPHHVCHSYFFSEVLYEKK